MKITLYGQPVSTNHVYKTGVRGGRAMMYMSNEGRCLKEDYQWQMKQFRKIPYKSQLVVIIDLYFGDHRRRDWDNWHKVTMDSGNGILWEDDSQIVAAIPRKRYDKEDPRIEMEVIPLNKDNPEFMVTVTANGKSYYSV